MMKILWIDKTVCLSVGHCKLKLITISYQFKWIKYLIDLNELKQYQPVEHILIDVLIVLNKFKNIWKVWYKYFDYQLNLQMVKQLFEFISLSLQFING